MNENTPENGIPEKNKKEINDIITAELSGTLIQSIMSKMNPEELKKHYRDMSISAIAINAVHDPQTNQFRAEQVKIGINLSFK